MSRGPRSTILLCVASILILFLMLSLYNRLQYRYLYSFKSEFKNKYSNIEDIRINRIGPGLDINIVMSGEIKNNEVSDIFNDIKKQPPQVLKNIWDKYDGFQELYINFCTNDKHGMVVYRYHGAEPSGSTISFGRYKSWDIENYSAEIAKTLKIENPPNVSKDESSQIVYGAIVNEQANGDRGLVYLGMHSDELIALDDDDTDMQITSIVEINDNKNAWTYGHKSIWTPKLCCVFDKANIAHSITVNGDIPTSLGLKNGDPVETLDELYGKYDNKYDFEGHIVYEYKIGDHFFNVSVQDGHVLLWGISKYRYDYNG